MSTSERLAAPDDGVHRTAATEAATSDLVRATLAATPSAYGETASGKTLELSTPAYFCVWGLIIGLHCACAIYLTQLARVYWFLAAPTMDYWGKLASEGRQRYLPHAGVLFGLMGALHWWQLLSIAKASLRARTLVLPLGSSKAVVGTIRARINQNLNVKQPGPNRIASAMMSSHIRSLALPSRFVWRTWQFLFSRNGVLGVESDLFPVVFIVREVIEVVSQSFQAHRSSELLPRPWLNNLFVMLVAVNCWSTPILQHFLRHHEGMERVACLLVDVVLNMGSSMLIPLAVFVPYYQAFIPAIFGFPFELLYDALWFSRLVMENQLLFSLASTDIFSKLVPHLGIYSSLTSAATLIHRRDNSRLRSVRTRTRSVVTATENSTLNTNSTLMEDFKSGSSLGAIDENSVKKSKAAMSGPAAATLVTKSTASRRKQHLVHYVFVVWGFVVIMLHVRAVTRSNKIVPGCRQVTGSWLATKYPCSVYAYNCYREGVSSPSEDSWGHLDPSSLVYLTVAHCSELTIPHSLQSFPNLLGFQLHNTTLVEWTKENSISATKHTKMVVVVIAKTNMSGIPNGMLEPLPAALLNIQLTYTNLTALPVDLHKKWHPLAALFIEHSLITTFPETLLTLYTRELSLHGNLIERVPELALKHQHFFSLVLSANPLQELPEALGEGTAFTFLSAERTLLQALPTWVNTRVEATMYLYGTPYCEAQGGNELPGAKLACVLRDNRVDGKVPLAVFDPRIPL
ncbi:hypothetical protein Gpo141_00005479 [Globisporangium polare]